MAVSQTQSITEGTIQKTRSGTAPGKNQPDNALQTSPKSAKLVLYHTHHDFLEQIRQHMTRW